MRGKSTKQIAAQLQLAERTITNHRQNMMNKVGVNNVAKLTVFAAKAGMV
ncbi:MAG: LuxR C-terminal-related transcriptional regulator [Bacteroidota bacterium]